MKTAFYFTLLSLLFSMVSCDSKQNNSRQKSGEDELVEVEEERKTTCPDCGGSGTCVYTCTACGGSGESTHYISGSRPSSCRTCNGTGRVTCRRCRGNGYTKCENCNGRGYKRCMSCKGSGTLVMGSNVVSCFACKGSGYQDCVLCDNGRFPCDCDNGKAICEDCFGSGCSGQESYSRTEERECSSCNGVGKFRSECDRCDGDGWIIEKVTVTKRKSEL